MCNSCRVCQCQCVGPGTPSSTYLKTEREQPGDYTGTAALHSRTAHESPASKPRHGELMSCASRRPRSVSVVRDKPRAVSAGCRCLGVRDLMAAGRQEAGDRTSKSERWHQSNRGTKVINPELMYNSLPLSICKSCYIEYERKRAQIVESSIVQ